MYTEKYLNYDFGFLEILIKNVYNNQSTCFEISKNCIICLKNWGFKVIIKNGLLFITVLQKLHIISIFEVFRNYYSKKYL